MSTNNVSLLSLKCFLPSCLFRYFTLRRISVLLWRHIHSSLGWRNSARWRSRSRSRRTSLLRGLISPATGINFCPSSRQSTRGQERGMVVSLGRWKVKCGPSALAFRSTTTSRSTLSQVRVLEADNIAALFLPFHSSSSFSGSPPPLSPLSFCRKRWTASPFLHAVRVRDSEGQRSWFQLVSGSWKTVPLRCGPFVYYSAHGCLLLFN